MAHGSFTKSECHVATWGSTSLRTIFPDDASFVTARGMYVESQPSWLDGGFGKFDVGSTTHQEEAHLGIDWTPAEWLTVHAHGLARKRGGLVEAYVDLRKGDFRLRAGQFFLPT